MKNPFLTGQKLYLRPLEPGDVNEQYVRWLNDPEVTHYLGVGRFPATLESVQRYLQRFRDSTTDLIFAIVDRESNLHIGNVTLNRIDRIGLTADTGLMIGNKEFWGRGYASEAWAILLDYAFQKLGLRKIIAGAVSGHEASLSVLRRLGFQTEGTLRKECWVDGEYRDAVRLGLFQEEFARSVPIR